MSEPITIACRPLFLKKAMRRATYENSRASLLWDRLMSVSRKPQENIALSRHYLTSIQNRLDKSSAILLLNTRESQKANYSDCIVLELLEILAR